MQKERKAPIEGEKGGFLSGVGILGTATVLSKMIGLFYRIPIVSLVGIGGMAYFLAASHIYVTLYLIVSAGLPVAVSILVAEKCAACDRVGIARVFRLSLACFALLGTLGAGALLLLAEEIADRIGLPDAALCLRVIAPTLLFSCISAAIRGYFQGLRRMTPTAVSEVIESLSKLIFGLGFAKYAVTRGYPKDVTAAFAVGGLLVGACLSMLYLTVQKLRDRHWVNADLTGGTEGVGETLLRILRIAAPVTGNALVLSIASVIDTALIPSRLLSSGLEPSEAEALYSGYGNLALPLFNFPAALITPIALALVPYLSAAIRSQSREGEWNVTASALRLATLLSIPASMGLSVFSAPILQLLYPREPSAVASAAPLLSILALSVLTSCLITVTNAILSAYGKASRALISMALGAGCKLIMEYFLVGNADVGIYGAPISTFLCNLVVTVCNLWTVTRCAKGSFSAGRLFFRPFLASSVAVGCAGAVYLALPPDGLLHTVGVLLSVAVAGGVYLFSALRNGTLSGEDLLLFPKGDRIAGLLLRARKGSG